MQPEQGQSSGRLSRALLAFRIPSYRWLWASSLTNALGFMTYGMGQGWLLLELTGSPFWVGLAPGIDGVTSLLVSPLGGLAADRWDRRKVVVLSHLATALVTATLGLLALLGVVEVWHVMLTASLQGAARSVRMPAQTSLTYDLVGRTTVLNAMAGQFMAMNLAAVIGPLAGGFMLSAVNPGYFFLGLGTVALLSSWLVLHIEKPPSSLRQRASAWKNLKEGAAFAVRDRPLRTVFLVVLVTESLGFSAISMLPVVVRQVLHADPSVLGFLISLWGLGGITSTLVLASLGQVKRQGWLFLAVTLCFGTSLVFFGLSRSAPLSFALFFVVGAAGASYDSLASTLVQTLSPDALRGRTTGFYGLLVSGVNIGGMGMGTVAQFFGVAVAIALGGGLVATNALRLIPTARIIAQRSTGASAGLLTEQPADTAQSNRRGRRQ
ncbi:MAG: MFS transporter [Chloroflexi bacterium]|nr:MFS transporter [Chloroflexota bacterium]